MPDIGYRPEVTVVIPAKNEGAVIESVIRTVFNSDYPQDKLQVVVVDDGGTDGTLGRDAASKVGPAHVRSPRAD